MDQDTLVERRIQGGQEMIDRLSAEGVAVFAACWVKEAFGGQWYLYVVTPLEGVGSEANHPYQLLYEILFDTQKQPPRVDHLEVKMIGPEHPVAKAVRKLHKTYARRLPDYFAAFQFPGAFVEEAYVYPPVPAAVK